MTSSVERMTIALEVVPGTDDGLWFKTSNGEVVVIRTSYDREVSTPLKGRCPCCVAQWLYTQTTEMRKTDET